MKSDYEYIKKSIDKSYKKYRVDKKTYYIESGNVVATEENNLLNLYLLIEDNSIMSDSKYAILTITKDFVIHDTNEYFKADVLRINGTFGSMNSVKRISDSILEDDVDEMITLGNKVYSLKDIIETYKEGMKILDDLGIKNNLKERIKRIKYFTKEIFSGFIVMKVNSIGTVLKKNITFINTDFFSIALNPSDKNSIENLDYHLLSEGIKEKPKSDNVYDFYRKKYDYNYNNDSVYLDTPEILNFVERRRNRNYERILKMKLKRKGIN